MEEQIFFLTQYGRNIDPITARRMPILRRYEWVNRLHKKIRMEVEAQQRALKEAKAKSGRRPRRR